MSPLPTFDFKKKNQIGHFRTIEFRKRKLEVGTQLPTSDFFFKIPNGSLTVPYTQNLIKHYEKFETEMVKKKLVRWSTEDELKVCNDKIKWFDDQRKRAITNADEMSIEN